MVDAPAAAAQLVGDPRAPIGVLVLAADGTDLGGDRRLGRVRWKVPPPQPGVVHLAGDHPLLATLPLPGTRRPPGEQPCGSGLLVAQLDPVGQASFEQFTLYGDLPQLAAQESELLALGGGQPLAFATVDALLRTQLPRVCS